MHTNDISQLLHHVAETIINPRFRSLAEAEVHEKQPGDVVTVADHESEEFLTDALTRMDPGCLVVGEEAAFSDPGLVGALGAAERAWVVDPVDGTRNFVRGSKDHAVMVAEIRSGVTVRAWIYQPQHERMFVAERGAGVECNGERMSAPEVAQPWVGASSKNILIGWANPPKVAEVVTTRWCCGVDYPRLLVGEHQFVTYLNTRPWDHLPGTLMVRELGGITRTRSGRPYDAGADEPGLLSAINAEVFDAAFPIFQRVTDVR